MQFLITILLALSATVPVSAKHHPNPKKPCDHCENEGQTLCGNKSDGSSVGVICTNHCWVVNPDQHC
ncbi:hypothetical protein HBI11_088240 [Parastagonospora nodorum]|nr:hypothetical protein HBI11_088240 [Parastagonospora nodorum]KAH6002417.1 hypothetical protein HBI84_088700 [Parastagonospora nodorum]KAH6423324.1 hypothetical protein HBI08_074650 [Parastagonospora nodorum]